VTLTAWLVVLFIKGGRDVLFVVDKVKDNVCGGMSARDKQRPHHLYKPCYATASMSTSNIWCNTDALYIEDETLDTVAEGCEVTC
jgi:hypothetical protein